jgi:uncharacterized linocin/CFP29 family protein
MPPITLSTWQNFLQSGLRVQNLRPVRGLHTNALLRHEEWLEIDAALLDIVRTQLVVVQDLINAGLVHALGGLGSTETAYERLFDMDDADIDMDASTPGSEDRVAFDQVTLPVPITHKDFRISIRQLEASRTRGDALDTTQVEVATRKVRDSLENMVMNGNLLQFAQNPIYGYTTHPNRVTGAATGDFGTVTNIHPTFVNMVNALEALGFIGPFLFYVARTQFGQMRTRFGDGSGETALESVQKIEGVEDVKASDVLTAGSLVGVNMMRETVDLAVGQDITPVQWDTMGGLIAHYKVMTAMVPRVKADSGGNCGVVHYTGA